MVFTSSFFPLLPSYILCAIGVADVQLINDLHKSEVFAVGRELGVPAAILEAPPSADLWNDQTDEGELGKRFLGIIRISKLIIIVIRFHI